MKAERPIDLTRRNSYRVAATAPLGLLPVNEKELIAALQDEPTAIVIGAGNNIILSASRYDRPFIIIDLSDTAELGYEVRGNEVLAYAGVHMRDLSLLALECGLRGLEAFFDIPSSLGGAIVMNAGAGGWEIKNLVVSVRAFNRVTGGVEEFNSEQLAYAYRRSVFTTRPELVVLSAILRLEKGDKELIHRKMQDIKIERWRKQPRDFPSAGSVFKRPPGRYVGQIMDELSLKGASKGGAQVSVKHGGFIVNFDAATGEDILNLIKHVRDVVQEETGIYLDTEQVII